MALTKILPADVSGKGVVGLADTPGLSTADMQAKFDELALDVIVPKHNALADELAGAGGAAEIGTADGSNVEAALTARARSADVLTRANETPYTPTADYHPATKKYIDDKVFEAGAADMRKAVYDTDGDGKVDAALTADTAALADDSNKLGGQPPSSFATAAQGLRADAAMPLAGGTFAGAAVGMTAPGGSPQLRNVVVVDAGTDIASLTVPAGTIIMVRK